MSSCDEKKTPVKLFTPGRVCLFGEHSDWAAGFGIHDGYCLVIGADQGLRAQAKASDTFRIFTELPESGDGRPLRPKEICVDFCTEQLKALVNDREEFFRYCAGAALAVMDKCDVGGIDIHINRMDLPLKKGVSSSAAVCVQVVSAFDRVYKIGLFPHEIMELAFIGERMTGSKCGRMDQACIFGKTPVLIKFAAEGDVRVDPLFPLDGVEMFFVDLAGEKDTVAILSALTGAYTDNKNLIDALGKTNERIVRSACMALVAGDSQLLGELMSESQEIFDRDIAPLCPQQLTSPLLHSLLDDKELGKFVYGGKGVGSHGDGSAQFVAKGAQAREAAIKYIQEKYPQMRVFTLDSIASAAALSQAVQ